jgi:hypothetical protein
MRLVAALFLVAVAAVALSTGTVTAQKIDRMNPIIAAQEKGEPIFGIAHPAIMAGRGRGGSPDPSAPPPPPIDLVAAARDTVAY